MFFSLLCRDYEQRLANLIAMVRRSSERSFGNLQALMLQEPDELADSSRIYIGLESMCSAILQKNVDTVTLLRLKLELFAQMNEMMALICANGAVSQADAIEVFQAEASILTECKLSASIPDAITEGIDQTGMSCFKRDFKRDVLDTMRHDLNGYRLTMTEKSTN